ncbi:MAG: hypothetical protein ACXU8N_09985 [Telluria sp.]
MNQSGRPAAIFLVLAAHALLALLVLWYRAPRHEPAPHETWMTLELVRERPRPPAMPPPSRPRLAAAHARPRPAAPPVSPAAGPALTLVPPAPAAAAPVPETAHPVDFDAARKVAAAVGHEETLAARTHPNILKTEQLTRQERLARAISRAEKPDCKDAYAGMGILAILPLAKNALSKDSSCKW